MSNGNSVTVQILDKEYSIICPQEERTNGQRRALSGWQDA